MSGPEEIACANAALPGPAKRGGCPAKRPHGDGSAFLRCRRIDPHDLHEGQGWQWRDGPREGPLPIGCVPYFDGQKAINPAAALDSGGWPERGE